MLFLSAYKPRRHLYLQQVDLLEKKLGAKFFFFSKFNFSSNLALDAKMVTFEIW
jgi:hypothetical protein